jgi:hypothetical protein
LYPRVSTMAKDYLGVTSTSVPIECAFSKAGSIVGKRRARPGDDVVQAICELQSFLTFNKGTWRYFSTSSHGCFRLYNGFIQPLADLSITSKSLSLLNIAGAAATRAVLV